MASTLYLHPRRTLVATWTHDGSVPCLSGYRELEATSDLASIDIDSIAPSAVVVSHGWFVHGYPCSTSQPDGTRRQFELENICGLAGHALPTIEADSCIAWSGGSFWRSMLCLDTRLVTRLQDSVGGQCMIVSDLRADIDAALASVPSQADRWMLFGRRGDRIITVVIGPEHSPELIETQLVIPGLDFQDVVLAQLALLRQRYGLAIRRVLLFGDYLTAEMIDDLRSGLKQAGVQAARLQPFRTVGSELSPDLEQRLIKRAHVVAPLMASLFPAF